MLQTEHMEDSHMFTRPLAYVAYIVAALALGMGTASAQDPMENTGGGPARNFGEVNQLAFSSENALEIRQVAIENGPDAATLHFAPAVDYFIVKNLSVGGVIGIDYSKVGDADGFRFSIGPRVGYNLSFTNLLGLWPKIGFTYAHSNSGYSRAFGGGGATISASDSNDAIAINVFVPLMFHPTTHFFVGIGPFLDADLNGDNRTVAYGMKLTIGGWLDV